MTIEYVLELDKTIRRYEKNGKFTFVKVDVDKNDPDLLQWISEGNVVYDVESNLKPPLGEEVPPRAPDAPETSRTQSE
jgi:hypothetical protein